MKQLCKRSLAAILLLVMLVGYFSGITIKVSAASYTYNWGTRGTVATELSDTAESWYSKYNTSYEKLSSYSGASSTSSVPSSALYSQLKTLMTKAHTYINGYKTNNTLLAYTDCQNGGGAISSFYSGASIGPSWDGTWNKEHTWPNSKGLGGSDEDDVMMIRPTKTSENSSRGNTAYGEGSSYYDPNDESGGKYNLHGDVARICLYVYVRWGNTSYMWGSSGVMESKEILLKWMEEDPVDTWELGRNDAVQSITGTRNVFVDYPELGFLLFGADVPSGYQSPSGSTSSAYTITATSNNTSYGTVSVSGKTITASPKTGYYASGYTVTSGSATVTQNGNTFTVNASSDCTIRINFAAKTQYTVAYMAAGSQYASKTAYGGDVISLSSYTGTVPEGYTFKGWVASTVSDTETKPATIYTAGSSYTVTANATLHALFSYSVGGTGATEYVLTDLTDIGPSDITVITITTSDGTVYAMNNDNGTSKAPAGVAITVKASDSGKVLASEPADNLKWNVGGSANAYIFYPKGDTSKWLYCTSTNNGVRVGTTTANTFKIDSSSGYLFHNGTSRYIGVYTTNPDWRCYTSSTQANIANQTIGFYVLREVGTTYYTTVIGEECDHIEVVDAAVAATCTETGLTEGSHCSVCNEVIVAQVEVTALGHTEAEEVVAPTCTEQGYTIYYCSVCGEVDEVSDYVNAFGHSYGDNGVCGVCGTNKSLLAGWNLILTDCIGMSFHLNLTAEEAAKTQVRFTANGTATTVDGSNAQIKDGKYVFSLALAAAQMTEKVTVEILSNGSVIQTGEYSVRQYAQTILNDQEGKFTDATKALVTQMLHYGAAAQTYFNYKVNDLANAGLEASTQSTPQTSNVFKVTGKVDGIDLYGATMMFRDKIAVRCYFTVTGDISAYSFTANGNTCTPAQKGDRYYIEIADINPQDLNDIITVKVNNTLTVTYSPMNYIVNMGQKGSQKLQVLVQALYDYHLAAVEYLEEQ